MPTVSLPEKNLRIFAKPGENLLDVLKKGGVYPDAVCGGSGRCGKCRVIADGREVLACKIAVAEDMTVTLPESAALQILQAGISGQAGVSPGGDGLLAAFDLGTTSVVCFLLDGKNGEELGSCSGRNPQAAFGADVVSRIRAALQGERPRLTDQIQKAMTEMIRKVCTSVGAAPEDIRVVSVVGNPAMQQLFLGMDPGNLAEIPFAPVLTEAGSLPCGDILPVCPNGQLLIVPDISGFVGADTMGCLLAAKLYEKEEITLLVDIGTNGEMVLGNKDRMIACAAAAGPALEGASIHFGMRAECGAIDHVWLEKGKIVCSVIGGGEARGICGSGLIDAVAVGLEMGLLNQRGRIQNENHILTLTESVYLTQEDIRQVQLAKGAICAGICLMAKELGLEPGQIQRVQLAGAFGSFLDPKNACRIGLLPETLCHKIEVVGNAAGSGAKLLACRGDLLPLTGELAKKVQFLELASLESFPRTFAQAMRFREADPVQWWMETAKQMGFDVAAVVDPQTLVAREDVRAMCAEDKCGAYNKNWTCPPAIGSVEACQEKMQAYRRGILLQTVGHMSKTVDSRCYRETQQRHMENFHALTEALRRVYPDALCLGAGGCRVCGKCAYPEACRFPEKAVSSMEGYGLFVTQVCRSAGLPYYYGEKTIAYTACILF